MEYGEEVEESINQRIGETQWKGSCPKCAGHGQDVVEALQITGVQKADIVVVDLHFGDKAVENQTKFAPRLETVVRLVLNSSTNFPEVLRN